MSRRYDVFDPTRCILGEGAIWHPVRQQLFWVDILDHKVVTRDGGQTRSWRFDGYVGALFPVDRDRMIVHESGRLTLWHIDTDTREELAQVESDRSDNRPNDGRADPAGGLWCSSMGLGAEAGNGAIYRWYRGEVHQLFATLSIPNAICFSPDGRYAYFTDTPDQYIRRVALDAEGWPKGDPEVWIDLRDTPHHPDGAVTDAAGNIWNAQWGSYRIACYSPVGEFLTEVPFGAKQTSCPAFGGPDLTTLYCTSASVGIAEPDMGQYPDTGTVMAMPGAGRGKPEWCVTL